MGGTWACQLAEREGELRGCQWRKAILHCIVAMNDIAFISSEQALLLWGLWWASVAD